MLRQIACAVPGTCSNPCRPSCSTVSGLLSPELFTTMGELLTTSYLILDPSEVGFPLKFHNYVWNRFLAPDSKVSNSKIFIVPTYF